MPPLKKIAYIRLSELLDEITKPELEMLLIISENLAAEYEKVKSKTKPKTFAKANIRCGRRR